MSLTNSNMRTGKLFSAVGLGCLLIGLVNPNISAQKVTIDSLKCWLSYMASDEMKGRANGSKEIEEIASWLSNKFHQYGVIPLVGQEGLTQVYLIDNNEVVCKNIIGYIPAKNKENNHSYIVLSAHFDHIGKRGNTICNGADDNASGIVTLLGIAKNIYENNVNLDCPIIFAAFSGEERGRLGSKFFCTSNIIPLNQAKLNINFELVGRSEENGKNKFYITGQKYSSLSNVIQKYNEDTLWQLIDIGDFGNQLYRMSDNYSFIQHINSSMVCIPAHSISTSIGKGYIHSGKDKVEFIDFENLYSFINYMTDFINYLKSASKNQ